MTLWIGTPRGISTPQKGRGKMLKDNRWGLGLAGAVVLALVVGVSAVVGLDHVVFVERESSPVWTQRIALVDEAIGRSDLSRAIYEWREGYGAAARGGRSA